MIRLSRLLGAALIAAAPALPLHAGDTGPSVAISFSDAALGLLSAKGESVIVWAYYAGDPVEGAEVPLTDEGLVFLGEETLRITPADQIVHFAAKIAGPVESVAEPLVNVAVWSGREAAEFNLLDCSMIDASLREIAENRPTILCGVVGQ